MSALQAELISKTRPRDKRACNDLFEAIMWFSRF
jgi:hypothetical protein